MHSTRRKRVPNGVIFKDILWLRGCKRVRKSMNTKHFNKILEYGSSSAGWRTVGKEMR